MKRTLVLLGLITALNFHARGDALDSWTFVSPVPPTSSAIVDYRKVIFAGGRFVAGLFNEDHTGSGYAFGAISTSTDGIHWNTTTFYEGITGLTYGNGVCVASALSQSTGGDGGAIYYSTDLKNWNSANRPIPPFPGLTGVAFGNGIFVAVGYDYEYGGLGYICTSSNGVNWTSGHPVGSNYLTSVAFGNGGFIVTGHPYYSATASDVFTSTDGVNWQDTRANAFLPTGMGGAEYVNGEYYIFSSGENDVSSNPSNPGYWDYYFGPAPRIWVPQYQFYLGVGGAGAIYTSSDAANWTARNTGETNQFFDIAYGNNRFVAVGGANTNSGYKPTIMVSGSTIPSLTVSNQLPAGIQVTLTGGMGPTWRLQASPDLVTWSNLVTFTNFGVSTQYLDSTAVNFSQRYYRTVSP